MKNDNQNRESYSAVLLTQAEHKFYTLALESDILSKTCIATTRVEDPEEGFQRSLDIKRAESIRDYIDHGGIIPGSIVLSAQAAANIHYNSGKKTIQFDIVPGAFLIIDGQHRVYGFRLSSKKLRVPVVIFSGLSKREEARLFIDINTLQKSVPNELLLDIKKLAETEDEIEQQARFIFDEYQNNSSSILTGLMSPRDKIQGKITRTTFNSGFKPILKQFSQTESERIYDIFNSFLIGLSSVMPVGVDFRSTITKPVIFRGVCAAFPTIARLVGLKFNKAYSAGNFEEVLKPISGIRKTVFTTPGTSYKLLAETLEKSLAQSNNDL
jgi:DGQHR domain-containing protein